MSATKAQLGTSFYRINREPIDGESVLYSYSDILDRVDRLGPTNTKKGAFYAGFITSVTNDADQAYNGPWYISYTQGGGTVTYVADRIWQKEEIRSYVNATRELIEWEVNTYVLSWEVLP